jgi:hypothetical protein
VTDIEVFEKLRRIQGYLNPLATEINDDKELAEKIWPAVWALSEAVAILVTRYENDYPNGA